MTKMRFRISCIVASLVAASAVNAGQHSAQGHASGLTAKVTLRDGTTRTVKLEGVGCPLGICSRTTIKARREVDSVVRTWFDNLAAIKDTTATDAFFLLKDGTGRRLSLVKDFRVLYFENRFGETEKLDLAKVKSVEFGAQSQAPSR